MTQEGTSANSFCEATVTMIPKSHKNPTKNKNYKAIFFVNTDAKILNKIFANQIQEYIKKIIHHDQVHFIPERQG